VSMPLKSAAFRFMVDIVFERFKSYTFESSGTGSTNFGQKHRCAPFTSNMTICSSRIGNLDIGMSFSWSNDL
jgi:hypothetical protein